MIWHLIPNSPWVIGHVEVPYNHHVLESSQSDVTFGAYLYSKMNMESCYMSLGQNFVSSVSINVHLSIILQYVDFEHITHSYLMFMLYFKLLCP